MLDDARYHCRRPSLHDPMTLCWPYTTTCAQTINSNAAGIAPNILGHWHTVQMFVVARLTVPDLFQTRTQPSMEPVASMVPADCQSIHSTTEHLSDSAPECANTVGTIASPDCDVLDHNKASGSPSLHNKAPHTSMI